MITNKEIEFLLKQDGITFGRLKEDWRKRQEQQCIYLFKELPTTYIRKWDFSNINVIDLVKYDLENKVYFYVGSHHCEGGQEKRNSVFLYDILNGKASPEIRKFFNSYINYLVIEKNMNIVESVEKFLETTSETYFDDIDQAREYERFINDFLFVNMKNGKDLCILSKKDKTLKYDKELKKIVPIKEGNYEYYNNILKTQADFVISKKYEIDDINEFTKQALENVEIPID